MKYPMTKAKRLHGDEQIISENGEKIATVKDFWQWAHSDLISNAERGILAEFLVACALGIQTEGRIAWDKYDLLSKEKVAIEIKTSGYLQSWKQDKLSKILFSINPTYGWDSQLNHMTELKSGRQKFMFFVCINI